jgi:hypothetical protein
MRPIDAKALEQVATRLYRVDVSSVGECVRLDDVLSALCAAPTLVLDADALQAKIDAIREIASPCMRTQNGRANPRMMREIVEIIDGPEGERKEAAK